MLPDYPPFQSFVYIFVIFIIPLLGVIFSEELRRVETRASVASFRACMERVSKTRQNLDHKSVRSLLYDSLRRRWETDGVC